MLSLFKKEDWWANWLGGFVILIAAAGLLRTVPKLPKWDHWQDALSVELLLPLVLWGLGLALVTRLGPEDYGGKCGEVPNGISCRVWAGRFGLHHREPKDA